MIRRMTALFMIPVFLLFSICNITIVHAEEKNQNTKDSVWFQGYEFQSYEPGMGDAELYEEAGSLIYEIDKISLEDWQNKVFIESGLTFEKGKQYTVDFTISASKDTYFSFFVNQAGTWNPVISEQVNIGDYVEEYSYTTSLINEDMAMEVLFQFGGGGNQAPLKISILDFSVHEAAVQEEQPVSCYRVADYNGLSVSAEASEGSRLYIEGSGLVFETGESGKVKIENLSFKKGCDYEIVYTVRADKNAQLACSVDPKDSYFAPGAFLPLSGGSRTISRRTGIQQADRQMEITFDVNKTKNGEPVKIIFDLIAVKEIKDGEEKAFRSAWAVGGFQLKHEESGGAAADFAVDEEGNVVYKIEKIGENDWNNKVMTDQGVTFMKGNAYIVEISLETDKEMRMFFGVNPKNKWEPKISETLLLKEGVNEFSFATDIQEQDEDMEVLFQFGGFGNTPPCNITMKGLSMEAASADDLAAVSAKRAAVTEPSLVKEYSFSKLDNYKFKGFVMNDPSGSELYLDQGVLVYDIKTFGVNQLVKKDLWFGKNCEYDVEMKVSASRPMNVECYVSSKNNQQDLEKFKQKIGKSVEVVRAKFRTGNHTDDQGRVVFDLSDNEGSGKFYVHSVTIKAVEEGIEDTVSMERFEVTTDSKSNAAATVVDGGLRYDIKRFGGNPWENKISINNIMEFKRNKTYTMDFDMSSTESIVFTCVLRNLERSEDEDEWEYFWERNHVIGGKKQHFRYRFKALEDNPLNEMIFELGGQGNKKKGPASIFISDIKITECTDYRKEKIQFSGAEGVFSSEHEGSLASGSLHQEDGVLVYEIGREGIADWHNQLIFNQGIRFEKGYRYRIDVTASASGGANMKFAVVSQKDWSEKIKKYSILLEEESTLSFETDTVQHDDENVEFSLSFGGMYNRSNTTIKISNIKIYKLSPGIPYTGNAIDDYDLEIEYENSDFYESAEFKGFTLNSTLIDSADASLYEEDGILHYDIKEIGAETYYNKLSINNEMTAKAGRIYKIEITARADKESKFFFVMNGIDGEWNPLVAETVNLSEDYHTYTLLSSLQDVDKAVDLIFEFGANGNPAPNHVMIKDFKISEIPMFDENPLTFKGNVFFHEETGEKAAGILYTNDKGNMVYYAKKLGETPSDNTVSTTVTLAGGKDNEIQIILKPQKGLLANVKATDAKTGETLGSAAEWAGDNETKEINLVVAAQDTDREVKLSVMFGQTEFADARQGNGIEFMDFSLTESIPVADEGTVIFKGNVFSHEETGENARGILYTNDSGDMVYYAKKLGNTPGDNTVSTTMTLAGGKDNKIKIALKPQKGLLVNADIIDAKTGEKLSSATEWAGDKDTKEINLVVAAQDADREVKLFVMFGQTEFADAREDNKIGFTDFSLTESDPVVDEGTAVLGGYEFKHEESGGVAKGILYNDENGSMVYYAQKLGNVDWHNKVFTVIENVEKGGEYTLTVEAEPEKGLDMVTTIPDAKNADTNGDAWYREWMGENTTTRLVHKITAQSDTLEIFFQFGQERFADARENNHIVFRSISLEKNEGNVDTDTVTLDGYEFEHEESGGAAKGSLYNDDNGSMVYYAEKLGNVDWHNKVFTSIDVEDGGEYTLTVEVGAEKGLDMVTTIPDAENADNNGDAWYKDWIGENATTKLVHKITARSDTLEIFFQLGQEKFAEWRENNHIVFKSISLENEDGIISSLDFDMLEPEEEPEEEEAPSNGEISGESENMDADIKEKEDQEGEEEEEKQNGTDDEGQNLDKEEEVTAPGGQVPEESGNNGAETEDQPEESDTESSEPDAGTEEEEENEGEADPEESGNNGAGTEDQPEGSVTESQKPDAGKEEEENEGAQEPDETGSNGAGTEDQPEGSVTESPEPDAGKEEEGHNVLRSAR